MKRMFLLFAVVVAMVCSATIAHAQNAEAPQRHGWGCLHDKIDPVASLYFQPLYGDVESVTVKCDHAAIEAFCNPFSYTLCTYIFNARGDVERIDNGGVDWTYNDCGKVINFHSKCEDDISGEEYNVDYVYNSSAQLVGASVAGFSDYYGEYSHRVNVNETNRDVIDLFGINYFVCWYSDEILCGYTKRENFSSIASITDRDPSYVQRYLCGYFDEDNDGEIDELKIENLSDLGKPVRCYFDEDNDGKIDFQNLFYNFGNDFAFSSSDKAYAGVCTDSYCLYIFNSNNKLTFRYIGAGDGPKFKTMYKYDINGRLVLEKSYLCDGLASYHVYEYDDDGRLIGRISYKEKYNNDYKVVGYEPINVSKYVYDSHGNLIRILTKHLDDREEQYSSIKYLIRYRE